MKHITQHRQRDGAMIFFIAPANNGKKWITILIEEPHGLLHLNINYSSVFQAYGRPSA